MSEKVSREMAEALLAGHGFDDEQKHHIREQWKEDGLLEPEPSAVERAREYREWFADVRRANDKRNNKAMAMANNYEQALKETRQAALVEGAERVYKYLKDYAFQWDVDNIREAVKAGGGE